MVNLTATLSTLITANHILHYHETVDAYGHVSVRNPNNNQTFFISGYLAPALVSSPEDLIEYYIDDASPVDPNAGRGYSERFIHSEILKRFPSMNSVVHSHSENVIPYTFSGVSLQPSYHMAGFLGEEVPIYDIAQYYNASDRHDMLVRDSRLGAALASYFSSSFDNSSATDPEPDHTLVLMRSHGFATMGPDVETAVYRTIYAHSNARVQTDAIALASQANAEGQPGEDGLGQVQYLNTRERVDSREMNEATQDRPWRMWVREVETYPGGLYQNSLGTPPT